MIEPFIAGVAGTGSMPVRREIGIPHLNNRLGQYQLFLQQGEFERPNWILEILNRLNQLPGMVNAGGSFRTYQDVPDVNFVGNFLALPEGTIGITNELFDAAGVIGGIYGNDWPRLLLAGFPMPTIDLATFAFPTRPHLAERHKDAFATAALHEIENAYRVFGSNMALCLESPAALTQVQSLRSAELSSKADELAREFVDFARKLPVGLPLVIHLCRGDLNHASWYGAVDSLVPMVVLANTIQYRFSMAGMVAPMMFLPTCAGDVMPSLSEAFFRPLSSLSMQVPVILGNIHEMRSLMPNISLEDAIAHNLQSSEIAARALGWQGDGIEHLPVAFSFSCGGARMTEDDWRFGIEVQRGMLNAAGLSGPVTAI